MFVFNFHHVEPKGLIQRPHQRARKMITITPEGLKNFITTLRVLGFHFISMQEVIASVESKQMLNNKSVLLTFDDGFVNNLTYGLPVLEETQCPATIFVLPGRLNQQSANNEWDQKSTPKENRDQLINEEQLKKLANSPYISIGSHGMTHQHLTELIDEKLDYEINESYMQLKNILGDRFCPVFAYPWGEYNDRVIQAMEKSAYKLAFTTDKSKNIDLVHSPYSIPRYSAYFRDGNPLILSGKLLRHQLLF